MIQRFLLGTIAMAVLAVSPAGAELTKADLPAVLEQLADERFAERQAAEVQLRKIVMSPDAKVSADELWETFIELESPETRSRLQPVIVDKVIQENFGVGTGFIGIGMSIDYSGSKNLPEGVGPYAIRIDQVLPGMAAERAGLRVNDRIIALDEHDFSQEEGFRRFQALVRGMKPGRPITLKILRGVILMEVDVVLVRRDSDPIYDEQLRRRIPVEQAFARRWLAERYRRLGE